MKRATVYRRKGKYLLHASSKTTDGVWIITAPHVAVTEEDGHEELGKKIGLVLDGSRAGVPHPTDWKLILDPLLALGGVKSWGTFCKSATCVEVEEENEAIVLLPTRNLGSEGGFEVDPSNKILTKRQDFKRLGAVMAELLTRFDR